MYTLYLTTDFELVEATENERTDLLAIIECTENSDPWANYTYEFSFTDINHDKLIISGWELGNIIIYRPWNFSELTKFSVSKTGLFFINLIKAIRKTRIGWKRWNNSIPPITLNAMIIKSAIKFLSHLPNELHSQRAIEIYTDIFEIKEDPELENLYKEYMDIKCNLMDCEVKILEELFQAKKINDNIINPIYE